MKGMPYGVTKFIQAYPFGNTISYFVKTSHHDLYTQITPQLYTVSTDNDSVLGRLVLIRGTPHFIALKHKTNDEYYLFIQGFYSYEEPRLTENKFIKIPYYYYGLNAEHSWDTDIPSVDYDDTSNNELFTNLTYVPIVIALYQDYDDTLNTSTKSFAWTYLKLTREQLDSVLTNATNITYGPRAGGTDYQWITFDIATPITGFDITDQITRVFPLLTVTKLMTIDDNNQVTVLWNGDSSSPAFGLMLPQDADVHYFFVETSDSNLPVHEFFWDHINRTLTIDGTVYNELPEAKNHYNMIPAGAGGVLVLDDKTIDSDTLPYSLAVPQELRTDGGSYSYPSAEFTNHVLNAYQMKINDFQNLVIFAGDSAEVIAFFRLASTANVNTALSEYYVERGDNIYRAGWIYSETHMPLYFCTYHQPYAYCYYDYDKCLSLYVGENNNIIGYVNVGSQQVAVRAFDDLSASINNDYDMYLRAIRPGNAPVIMDAAQHSQTPSNYAEYVRIFANEANPPLFLEIGTITPKDEIPNLDDLYVPNFNTE